MFPLLSKAEVLNIARSLLIHAHVPSEFWIHAVLTSFYLLNRLPLTPLGKRPSIPPRLDAWFTLPFQHINATNSPNTHDPSLVLSAITEEEKEAAAILGQLHEQPTTKTVSTSPSISIYREEEESQPEASGRSNDGKDSRNGNGWIES